MTKAEASEKIDKLREKTGKTRKPKAAPRAKAARKTTKKRA